MSTMDKKRKRLLALLRAGYLTQSEAAELMGVSRQRIHQWARDARIHAVAARARHLRELLRDAVDT